METHVYLEVLGVELSGPGFRWTFLPGVLFPVKKGELPLATPAFGTDVRATVTALPVGEEPCPLCLGPTPLTFWLFTHVNLDFFKKETSLRLVPDAGSIECLDKLGGAARVGRVLALGAAGVVLVIVGLVSVLDSHVVVGSVFA